MSVVQELIEPKEEYRILTPDQLRGRYQEFQGLTGRTGIYSITNVCRLTSRLQKQKCNFIVTQGFVIVIDDLKGIVKRVLHVRDIEAVTIADDEIGKKALLVPYRRTGDPSILLLFPNAPNAADTTKALRVMNYARSFHNADPIRTQFVTTDQIKKQYTTTAVAKPKDYMKGPWMRSKRGPLAMNSVNRPTKPPTIKGASAPQVTFQPTGPLRNYTISLPSATSPIGIEMKLNEGKVIFSRVEPHSPAALANIPEGLVLSTINGKPINNVLDVSNAVVEAKSLAGDGPVQIPVFGWPPPGAHQGQLSPTNSFAPPPIAPQASIPPSVQSPAPTPDFLESSFQDQMQREQSMMQQKKDQLLEREREMFEREMFEREQSLRAKEEALQQRETATTQAIDNGFALPIPGKQQPELLDDFRSPPSKGSFSKGTDHPDALRFDAGGDVVEFIPEGIGIVGEFHNGKKRGVAHALHFNSARRELLDQDGRGGKVPNRKDNPLILRTIATFCDDHHVPITVEGEEFIVKYRTAKGDKMTYTPDLGAIGQHFNGQLVGMATELNYDLTKGVLVDQEAHGGKIPEESRLPILQGIVDLCGVSDVPHNINMEAVRSFEKGRRELESERQHFDNMKKQHDMSERQQAVQKASPPSIPAPKEAPSKEKDLEEQESRHLKQREAELADLERLLLERERAVNDFKDSPAGLYHRLKTELSSEHPNEEEITDSIVRVPNSLHWYDLCTFFEDDGADLPRLLRSLSPSCVHAIESALRFKGVHLPASTKQMKQKAEEEYYDEEEEEETLTAPSPKFSRSVKTPVVPQRQELLSVVPQRQEIVPQRQEVVPQRQEPGGDAGRAFPSTAHSPPGSPVFNDLGGGYENPLLLSYTQLNSQQKVHPLIRARGRGQNGANNGLHPGPVSSAPMDSMYSAFNSPRVEVCEIEMSPFFETNV